MVETSGARGFESGPVPVTVIGGYLGAGKTTLVNHLLRHAQGRRLAVMVNDFGALPIDADLIEGERDGNLLSIAGGCVCCSYGSDLVDALMDLPARVGRPDRILIEASGVAIPGNVAGAVSLLADCRLDAVVVLADADNVLRQASDTYMGDTITRQLADADLVLVSKADLVSADELAAVRALVGRHAEGVPQLVIAPGDVPVEVLLDFAASPAAERVFRAPAAGHLVGLTSAHWHPHAAVDMDALVAALTAPAAGVLRAKGFLDDASGTRRLLQVVGHRTTVSAAPATASPGLVCIGMSGQFDPHALEPLLGVSAHVADIGPDSVKGGA